MNRVDHLLVMLGEELAEVAQEAAKCLRFGPNNVYTTIGISNSERLRAEFNDLLATVEMLQAEGVLPEEMRDEEHVNAKKAKFEKHLKYSESLGRAEFAKGGRSE